MSHAGSGGLSDWDYVAGAGEGGRGERLWARARMKVDQMTTGMQYNTVRQQAATRHFATTGQKVSPDLSLPPKG